MGHNYVSHIPDEYGMIHYDDQDHVTWSKLIKRQNEAIKGRAYLPYIERLKMLNFSLDEIPQHKDVSKTLQSLTGWGVQPVAALIPATEFFTLLSNRLFPAASFIRIPQELNYIEEPDIFHEFYGHCPLITLQPYADFLQNIGKLGLTITPKLRKYVFRLFWFSIEFGLIKTNQGLVSYGGGILSSIYETVSALEDKEAKRVPWDLMRVLRTDYRIDIPQPIYFYVESLDEIYHLTTIDLASCIEEAAKLGDLPVEYPPRTITVDSLIKREVDC